jgi:DNA-binding NtrC family response regulator
VLQEKTFERVGSSETMRANVRVLATTNRDLLAEVKAGRFRHDLYYRLAVVPLWVPPLRERRGDVPELVDYFLKRCAARLERDVCLLQPDALDLLVHHHWPGNVRELENIVTRASVLYGGNPVRADELRRWLIGGEESGTSAAAEPGVPVGISLEEMERKLIEATLEHFGGHRAKTAQALGIGLRTLSGKLRQYGYAPREKPLMRAG